MRSLVFLTLVCTRVLVLPPLLDEKDGESADEIFLFPPGDRLKTVVLLFVATCHVTARGNSEEPPEVLKGEKKIPEGFHSTADP